VSRVRDLPGAGGELAKPRPTEPRRRLPSRLAHGTSRSRNSAQIRHGRPQWILFGTAGRLQLRDLLSDVGRQRPKGLEPLTGRLEMPTARVVITGRQKTFPIVMTSRTEQRPQRGCPG
jgi:hypothetical protein